MVTQEDKLDRTFSALADPTRRALLARLSRGEATVADLGKPFLRDMSPPAISKHLKVLEKAGLITRSRTAQWRPCKLNAQALKDSMEWMEQYRIFMEDSLDRLGDYLQTVTAEKKAAAKNVKGKKHEIQK